MADQEKKQPAPAKPAPAKPAPAKSAATTKPRPKRTSKPKRLPPFNVILLNDDQHTYEYVITMLAEIFAYDVNKGFQLAKIVDEQGRAIVMTTHKELAELKRDQISAYGTDIRVATCKGSMSAKIEPAA